MKFSWKEIENAIFVILILGATAGITAILFSIAKWIWCL